MIVLHGRGGFQLLEPGLDKEEQETLFYNVSKILRTRRHPSAAGLLERVHFDIYNSTNDFNDEFCVLFAQLPFSQYEEMRELLEDEEGKYAFRIIADTISEIGPYIRFVACDLTKETPNAKWQRSTPGHMEDGSVLLNKTLPVAVCAVVNEVLAGSHATLNTLFRTAGAPGDPPELSHATK